MAEEGSAPTSDAADGCAVFGCALAFWLVVPLPMWVLGAGFAGEFVLLPASWDLISFLWILAFYAPLALMAVVGINALRSRFRYRHRD